MRKFITYLSSFYLQSFFFIKNRFSNARINYDCNSEVFVSLTSHGDRLFTTFLAIESIVRQTYRPKLITLWLAEEDIPRHGIPPTLLRLQKRGLRIIVIDENIRSYKKIFYQYRELNEKGQHNSYIVTADDDVFYPKTWLSLLYEESKTSPNKVICSRAKEIAFSDDSKLMPYKYWKLCPKSDYKMSKTVFPTGVGGVLYPLESLKGLDENKFAFLEKCFYADDIWLKLLSLTNGFSSKKVPMGVEHFPPVISKNMKGLEKYNVDLGYNDLQFKDTMEYFKLQISDLRGEWK